MSTLIDTLKTVMQKVAVTDDPVLLPDGCEMCRQSPYYTRADLLSSLQIPSSSIQSNSSPPSLFEDDPKTGWLFDVHEGISVAIVSSAAQFEAVARDHSRSAIAIRCIRYILLTSKS